MISVEQTQTIHLGRTGEQDVTEVVFNIAPWIAQFGQGNVLLNVKRACDTIPYPANIVVADNTAVWTVSKKDVESYGTGKAELTYLVDGQIKKSVLYKTYTEKSLADITPTPENGDSWLDAMTKQVLKAEGHSTQAESYAHGGTGARADEDTDNAKYYSEQANLDAQTTDADRQVVEQAKTEVLESAKEVDLNKQAVENVAKNVSDAETRIGNVENDIKLMQTDVKANKDAVDTAKKSVDVSQADVTKKAEQVEKDRIKVENAVLDLSKPVREHNASPTAHQDIRTEVSKKANKAEIPTKVSDLANDSGYLTQHQDISGKADKTEIPTKVSELQNDSGFLTAHQDISGKVDKITQEQKDTEQDNAIYKLKIKAEAVGNPLNLTDSDNGDIVSLIISGSTAQNGVPSPENPVEIVNGVVDSVSCNGKNLLPYPYTESTLTRNGVTFTDNGNGTISLNGVTETPSIFFFLNKGIRFSENLLHSNQSDKTDGLIVLSDGVEPSNNDIFVTFNKNTNQTYITIGKKGIVLKNVIIKPQLELGTQPTPYEPYKGFTSPIPPIELSKWDKIKKIDGVWKKENCTTHYPNYNGEEITTEYYSTTGELSIGAEVYCRKEPNYEILPQETQDVLNRIQTFYPNSTIQTNNGIELNLTYIADTKNYVDNKIAEKVAELNKNIVNTQALALER